MTDTPTLYIYRTESGQKAGQIVVAGAPVAGMAAGRDRNDVIDGATELHDNLRILEVEILDQVLGLGKQAAPLTYFGASALDLGSFLPVPVLRGVDLAERNRGQVI